MVLHSRSTLGLCRSAGSLDRQLPIYRPEAALAGLIVMLPNVLLFLFSQRFVVAGMLSGSQKG
jgi:ABC-type maltose transport system permease subunit